MSILGSKILIKFLNRIPPTLLVKVGYSRIGSKIVNEIRKSESKTVHEISYGVKIYYDLTNPRTWELIAGKDPEKKVKDSFVENISLGDTVIDLGANIGEFSLIAAKKVGPSGRIIAVEPLAETLISLKKNMDLNGFQNYSILECAVGNKLGKMSLYKKSESATMGLLDPVKGEENMVETNQIDVKTIDSIITKEKIKKVGMLKIDVEGYEYEVLLGCQNSFKQKKIEKIICEIHLDYLREKGINKNKIYSYLQENGFSIKTIDELDRRIHIFASTL